MPGGHGHFLDPDRRALWPADYRLRLTYRLEAHRLRLEALSKTRTGSPCRSAWAIIRICACR
jgi:hypothetical protein